LNSDRPFIDATAPLGAAISLGVALALGSAVAGRWFGDSTKDDALGEIVRAVDLTGQHALMPYRIVSIVGIAISLWGGFLLIAAESVGPDARVWLYGVEVLLASYGLLGMLDVVLLGFRNQARQARLRALRELDQRRREG
jgi:hypothetical protein